ncbi:hypothetical protein V6N13_048710 [Hibiscus sabdariffa]|uniref:Peptidyl-prolyl cis-trans isomerase n=1 Tax=Hibiscus sabdariffa TaxID=183260 RepID=A0ABR2DJ78_9ROSI
MQCSSLYRARDHFKIEIPKSEFPLPHRPLTGAPCRALQPRARDDRHGSRRKASWKDPKGRVISAATRDFTVSQLKLLRDDIVSGKAKFDEVACRYSNCSSTKHDGDLGQFVAFNCGANAFKLPLLI